MLGVEDVNCPISDYVYIWKETVCIIKSYQKILFCFKKNCKEYPYIQINLVFHFVNSFSFFSSWDIIKTIQLNIRNWKWTLERDNG